jgi:hypothetical protein
MRPEALAFVAAVAFVPQVARASDDDDGSKPGLFGSLHPEIAGRAQGSVTNPYWAPPLMGGGPGVRAGVSFPGVYAGLSYTNYLSESSCLASYPGSCGSMSAASYGIEVGYGHAFGRFLLRGLLGVGDRVVTTDGTDWMCSGMPPCSVVTSQSHHATENYLYFAPALLAAVVLGPVLAGADATLMYLPAAGAPAAPSASYVSLMLGAQLGVRL